MSPLEESGQSFASFYRLLGRPCGDSDRCPLWRLVPNPHPHVAASWGKSPCSRGRGCAVTQLRPALHPAAAGIAQPRLPVTPAFSQPLRLAPLALRKRSTSCPPWPLLLALPRADVPPFQGKTPLPSTRHLHSAALHYLGRALLPLSRVKRFTATLDACLLTSCIVHPRCIF